MDRRKLESILLTPSVTRNYMNVNDLETPVMVVDVDQVERNLVKMQTYCDKHGLGLRPHIKTHKMPHLARRQLELGAIGITCQKLSEAMVFAQAGLTDIFVSYAIIGGLKAARLAALAQIAEIKVAADSADAVMTASEAAESAGRTIGVIVDFDSGANRTGVVSVDEAFVLAKLANELPGTSFAGLMTYPTTELSVEFIRLAQDRFAREGVEIGIVSGGGTPNAWSAHQVKGLTEVRVGTYIYFDRSQVGLGASSLDECAAHVHATVVSRPTPDRAILDSGSKSLSSDFANVGVGYGLIREYPNAIINRLYEEHAVVDLAACSTRPTIGERVRVLPNHICVVTNLHDTIAAVSQDRLVDFWRVEARGKTI